MGISILLWFLTVVSGAATSNPSTTSTSEPTHVPTTNPTKLPTLAPSSAPTSQTPTTSPSRAPTSKVSDTPTLGPTKQPTLDPTSNAPTSHPSRAPTNEASSSPTVKPTSQPTLDPTSDAPTSRPSQAPTNEASSSPTLKPTAQPTLAPTSNAPTSDVTSAPSTTAPSAKTNAPTSNAPTSDTGAPTAPTSSAPTSNTNAPTPAGPSTSEGVMSLNNFVKYPGYAGTLTSSGDILLNYGNGAVEISYNLRDVDVRCGNRNKTLANSCGLHIHAGFSCDTDSGVGGHYYNASAMNDPWAFGSYYVVVGNATDGRVDVQYGHSIEDTKGRVFVLHDFDGRRVSCSVLPATTDTVTLGKLGVYLNYTGPLRADGCITMQFRSSSVQIKYDLTGVDSRCTNRNASVANSCGLHIHSGSTCDAAGPHYYDAVSYPVDPWTNASYVVQTQTKAQGVLDVEFGYGFDWSQGRAVVLHDFDGNRMSCAVLPFRTDRTSAMLPPLSSYPGYNGTLNISGAVNVDFRGNGVKISFALNGTEPSCPGSAPNSCGIHIHSGYSCSDAQGHYFDVTKYPMDPWAKVSYWSNGSLAQGSVIVSYGNNMVDSSGRVIVVHGYDGSRVACAVIPGTTDRVTTAFQSAANQTNGLVQLDFRSTSVRMAYNLMNVDPRCANQTNVQNNSCTLQIFEGSCGALGNHYYKTASDPWQRSYYVVVNQTATGYLNVEFGYGFATTQGRSLVINDQQGTMVACAGISKGGIDFQGGRAPSVVAGLAAVQGGGISGDAVVLFQGMGVVVNYELFGLDPQCAKPGGAINSCGIHVHRGFNCSMSGSHFFDPMAYPLDPWSYSIYTSVGSYGQGSLVVSSGEDWDATQGRTLVVHNYDGTKAACSAFPEATDRVVVAGFKQFSQSNSSYSFLGNVAFDFRKTSARLRYSFANADPRCVGTQQPDVKNSCGLHIHAGVSCDSPAAAGPHYYDPSFPTDPWATVFFTSTAQGYADGILDVEFGYGYSQSRGRAVVVHDWNGAMVSCALIPAEQGNTASVVVEVPQVIRNSNYTGVYNVKFEDVSIAFKGGGSVISYKMTGVPCECAIPGTAPNSCGIQIRDSVGCEDIGSTWYNHNLFAADPWTTVQYTASPCSTACQFAGNATAEGSLVVSYGYGYPDTKNKFLVVYDYLGERMGCVMISSPVIPSGNLDLTGSMPVPTLQKYPGYQGSLNVSGRLLLKNVNETVKITYFLDGVEPACSMFDPAVPNSCGLSVHTGFSCNSDAQVGMHFFNSTAMAVDPWQTSGAKYISTNSSAVGSIGVDYGYSIDLTKGRVVVVSNYQGVGVACAVLPSTTDAVTLGKFTTFANVQSDVTGCVGMDFRGSSVEIKYDIAGVDPRCSSRSQAPNSCGLHIHSNTTCEIAQVGSHFYNTPQDPWSNISYAVDAGRAKGNINVDFGYGFDASQGRAVVIHDYDGTKTHCVLLPNHQIREVAVLPPLEPYPGYNGTLNITGSVQLDFRGQGVKISYALSGIEPICSVPGLEANSCGIHIHQGFSCENAGGHFYNKDMYSTDPWATAPYIADANTTSYSLIVSFGYDYVQAAGRVVVVHSYSGLRVACAVIPALTDPVLVTGFKSFTNMSKVGGTISLNFRSTSVRMDYNLTGLDSACAKPGNASNSCGIQIHSGTSCDSVASVGIPFFLNTTADPWQFVHIVGPASSGSLDVEFGFGYTASKGRALVIHNFAGAPIACAIIPGGSVSLRNTASVVSLVESSTGLLGKFVFNFAGNAVRVGYDLSGVDSNCTMRGAMPFSCGLRILRGFTCDGPQVSLFQAALDPWTYATYTIAGNTSQGSIIVQDGVDFRSSMGRAIAVHDHAGLRVGCAILPQTTDRTTSGMVTLDFRTSSVRLTYAILNGDSRCTQPKGNLSCGIRILTGTSCKAGQEGTDYYDSTISTDPWPLSFYKYGGNQSRGFVDVENGYNFQQTVGHALAIYNFDGIIANCSLISSSLDEEKATNIALGKYPGYSGPYMPTFTLTSVDFSGAGAAISYSLSGVPCECSEIGPAANSCGLHIHDGGSCAAANGIKGHWYNTSTDPWSFTPYVALPCSASCGSGIGSASGTLTVSFGYGGASSMSKVLVVHDYFGNRIGCAQIYVPANPAATDSYLILPFLITIGALLVILIIGVVIQNRKKPDPRGTIHQALLSDAPPQKARGMSVNEG